MSGNRIRAFVMEAMRGGGQTGYGSEFTARLPHSVTYREIIADLKNIAISQIAQIKLTLEGEEIYNITGQELHDFRVRLGLHYDASTLVIPFVDMSQTLIAGQDFSELVVLAGENVILSITTKDATQAQIDAGDIASFDLRATYQAERKLVRTRVPRLFSDVLPVGRTGKNHFDHILKYGGSDKPMRLQRMIIKSGDVNRMELFKGRISEFEKTVAANKFDLKESGVIQTANEYIYDSVASGFAGTDALIIGPDFNMDLYLDAATDLVAVFQAVEVLTRPNA